MSATRESALIVDATQLDSGALRRPEAPPLCFVESYSGVRGAFGDGPTIGNETMAIVLAYAHAFAGDVVLRWSAVGSEKSKLRLIVGRDPRPTSAAIARLQRVGLHLACEELGVELALLDPGIVTTPAIQAMVRDLDADGGVMITGSHNPADFNGLKYLTGNTEPEGRSANDSGSVLNGVKMAAVIAAARRMLRRIAGGDLTLIERANSFAPPANEEVEAAPGYSALLRTRLSAGWGERARRCAAVTGPRDAYWSSMPTAVPDRRSFPKPSVILSRSWRSTRRRDASRTTSSRWARRLTKRAPRCRRRVPTSPWLSTPMPIAATSSPEIVPVTPASCTLRKSRS